MPFFFCSNNLSNCTLEEDVDDDFEEGVVQSTRREPTEEGVDVAADNGVEGTDPVARDVGLSFVGVCTFPLFFLP